MLITSCLRESKPIEEKIEAKNQIEEEKVQIFTQYSSLINKSIGFNDRKAINCLAEIDNEYFSKRAKGKASRYYGTEWRKGRRILVGESGLNRFEEYRRKLNMEGFEPDSMHCTIYAYESLKAGLGEENLAKLEENHRIIWKNRENAGWSVGYLLVRDFNWKAYLVIDEQSKEYAHCMKGYEKAKSYPVWRQPDIPLEAIYILGRDDEKVESLLQENEYGWGFSEQGIHTWVTRFDVLKECNWSGSPLEEGDLYSGEKPLFIETRFLDYTDYQSHILIFPEKVDG